MNRHTHYGRLEGNIWGWIHIFSGWISCLCSLDFGMFSFYVNRLDSMNQKTDWIRIKFNIILPLTRIKSFWHQVQIHFCLVKFYSIIFNKSFIPMRRCIWYQNFQNFYWRLGSSSFQKLFILYQTSIDFFRKTCRYFNYLRWRGFLP